MANTLTGKILMIGQPQNIPSKDGSKMYVKREVVIDMTRFDPYTGERGFENTPLLEFFGDSCNELNNYRVGQIVTISFDVQGSKYTDRDGVQKIFTRVRPYKIEAKQTAQQPTQQVQQPQRNYQQQPQRNYQQSPYQQGPQFHFPPEVDDDGKPF